MKRDLDISYIIIQQIVQNCHKIHTNRKIISMIYTIYTSNKI